MANERRKEEREREGGRSAGMAARRIDHSIEIEAPTRRRHRANVPLLSVSLFPS